MATVKTKCRCFLKSLGRLKGTDWKEKSQRFSLVQANYTPYDGDESFLAPATERSLKIKKQ